MADGQAADMLTLAPEISFECTLIGACVGTILPF